MRAVRQHLTRVAMIWLLCHASVLTGVPVSLSAMPDALASEQACTCAHSGATECPMHHQAQAPSKSPCSCRSTADPQAATLGSLLGPIAVLTAPGQVIRLVYSDAASSLTVPLIDTPTVPDAPPPRA